MSTERDTHFLGFAKLLYDEIGKLDTSMIQRFGDYTSFDVEAKKLIAQRAYDLAIHVVDETIGTHDISHIPDLTEWPR